MSDNSLMSILKARTKADHDRLESLVYFKELIRRSLPLDSYIRYLRLLSIIHWSLEKELSLCADERVKKIWHPKRARYNLLINDLEYYSDYLIKDVLDAVNLAQDFCSLIRRHSSKGALYLLGYFYVFEGSTRGSVKLREILKENFNKGKDFSGISYFVNYGDKVNEYWDEFVEQMNALKLDEGETEKVCLSAIDCFQRLYQIIECLDGNKERKHLYTVIALNPMAGNHPVPQDEKELKVSIDVAYKCLKDFPYLMMRYGTSGRHFTLSDSAWLTYLTEFSQEIINTQVNWLLNVLTTRGVPSILLEIHLDYLFQELTREKPEKREDYNKLNITRDLIQNQRVAILNDETVKTIQQEFKEKITSQEGDKLPEAIPLLASAMCDEFRGIEGALSSLKSWLYDAKIFSQDWIKAILEAEQKLKQIALSKK